MNWQRGIFKKAKCPDNRMKVYLLLRITGLCNLLIETRSLNEAEVQAAALACTHSSAELVCKLLSNDVISLQISLPSRAALELQLNFW